MFCLGTVRIKTKRNVDKHCTLLVCFSEAYIFIDKEISVLLTEEDIRKKQSGIGNRKDGWARMKPVLG